MCGGIGCLLNTSIPARGLRPGDLQLSVVRDGDSLLNTSIPARGLRLFPDVQRQLLHVDDLLNTSIPARGLRPCLPVADALAGWMKAPKHLNPRQGITTRRWRLR